MRSIDPSRFHVATRGTSRQINRQIALTLIGSHQPISRADLARRMNLRRGAVGVLIDQLLREGLIVEGTTGRTVRGRRPTLLYINTRQRSSVAVDIRASRTYLMLADPMGRPRSDVISFRTSPDHRRTLGDLSSRIPSLIDGHPDCGRCEGIGVAVPGMIDSRTSRVIHAPTLGWRDLDIQAPLAKATGLPVHVENAGRACAFAQMWAARQRALSVRHLVFVSVSDGVGVGVIINGELMRGRDNIAGEFAHMPLSIHEGPRCSCGAVGCWEAHISNLATLARYFGRVTEAAGRSSSAGHAPFSMDDLVARARGGDRKAAGALQTTARHLGLGLGGIVNTINPDCLFVGGEITTAWDLVGQTVRTALAERALTRAAAATDIVIVSEEEHPRLRGAAMLVTAPAFAAPVVA